MVAVTEPLDLGCSPTEWVDELESNVVVLGIDPGQTTGFALLPVAHPREHELAQLTQGLVVDLVEAAVARVRDQGGVPVLAIERFVSGPRSGKLARPYGAAIAKALIGALSILDVPTFQHPAATHKPWATDARLDKLGVVRRGMPHAADAFRVALYTAVRSYGMPDPLSRPRGARTGPDGGTAPMLTGPLGDAPQPPTDRARGRPQT